MGKMPKSRLEVLEDARYILDKPEHWTQGAFARDLDGSPVSATSCKAVCFCLVGAFIKAGDGADTGNIYRLTMRVFPNEQRLFASLNDSSTHAEILTHLDALIEFERVDSVDIGWED